MGMPPGAVTVVVPAGRPALRVLRLVASDVGRSLDFGYDRIEDARLAVNEAATALLEDDGGVLTCRLGTAGRVLEVDLRADPAPAGWAEGEWVGSLGHLVLSRVAAALETGPGARIGFVIRP